MATGGSRFDDKEYINWLRATLSLIYMKEGLEQFTLHQTEVFHDRLFRSLGQASQACSGICSSSDIKKDSHNQTWHMHCSSCNAWLQSVIALHRNAPFPNLSTENTDPTQWYTAPWETAKLFMPFGCEKQESAKDTDVQGILSLYTNCKHFSNGRHIGKKDLIEKLLSIRNKLMHSGTFKVTDTHVQDYLQTFLLFLDGMSGLTASERDSLQKAVEKIKQLQSNKIEMSINKELELRALQKRQVALDRDLRSLVSGLQNEQDNQETEIKQQGETIKELKAAKGKFDEFLQENKLMDQMANLSKYVSDIDKRLNTIEEKLKLRTSTVADSLMSLDYQCEELQKHLLRMYGKMKFWENPLSSEEALLSQMYVQPSVKIMREIDDQGMLAEMKQQKSKSSKLTYEEIFLSKTGPCENIYLTGDAGTGKTTFCNQLLLEWCNAVQNIQNEIVSFDDLKELASFRFLFHINLRDTETIYHVEDMIQEQLLSNVPVTLNLSDILKAERCLVVLDGLDEWSCPENVKKCPDINEHIPGRNTAHTNCVFLTTSRPWKYDVIALKNKDVDKYLELSGISAHSSDVLVQKILNNLDNNSNTRQLTDDFYGDVHKKKLNEFLSVPVLLIQLLTLWHAGKDFGSSQLQLYCSMLELFFERSKKNLPQEISQFSSTTLTTPRKLPECFSTKDNCQNYTELLHCLAKLAYKALFNKQKEEALVFKSSRLEIFGISDSDIKLCLHCGILSHRKDYANYTGKYKKFSFLHKKVQEVLAALYLVTNDNVGGDILKEVKQFCNSVETILEMNQVWLFVAGMDPDMTRRLFEHLNDVVSSDEQVKTYRQTLGYASLINRIQSCVSDCLSEGIDNGHHYENPCLEDCIVSDAKHLLFCSDKSKVKSVCIVAHDIDAVKMPAIADQFLQCRSLQKFWVDDPWPSPRIPDCTVAAIIKNNCASLTSLYLNTQSKVTDKLVTAILCTSINKSLIALGLFMNKLTHEHKSIILHSVSQSSAIRQLRLVLNCKDHHYYCRARIELSAMTQLQDLWLNAMYIYDLQSLPVSCVENVDLRYDTLSVTSLRDFVRGLCQARRKVTVRLAMVTFTETSTECANLKDFLRSCPGLVLKRFDYNCFPNTWLITFDTSSQ